VPSQKAACGIAAEDDGSMPVASREQLLGGGKPGHKHSEHRRSGMGEAKRRPRQQGPAMAFGTMPWSALPVGPMHAEPLAAPHDWHAAPMI
jgi:hypothetical protein